MWQIGLDLRLPEGDENVVELVIKVVQAGEYAHTQPSHKLQERPSSDHIRSLFFKMFR